MTFVDVALGQLSTEPFIESEFTGQRPVMIFDMTHLRWFRMLRP
jgi:hypothetical protein